MDCLPQLHVAAIHAEAGFNSFTPGLGVLCRKKDYLAGAGVYHNSIRKTSAYAIIGWQPWEVAGVKFGVVVGVATGYYQPIMPMAAGAISYRGVNLLLIPRVQGVTPATLALSFDLHFPKP